MPLITRIMPLSNRIKSQQNVKQTFNVFKKIFGPYYQMSISRFWKYIDRISKTFKMLLEVPSGFVGACLFQICQIIGVHF